MRWLTVHGDPTRRGLQSCISPIAGTCHHGLSVNHQIIIWPLHTDSKVIPPRVSAPHALLDDSFPSELTPAAWLLSRGKQTACCGKSSLFYYYFFFVFVKWRYNSGASEPRELQTSESHLWLFMNEIAKPVNIHVRICYFFSPPPEQIRTFVSAELMSRHIMSQQQLIVTRLA